MDRWLLWVLFGGVIGYFVNPSPGTILIVAGLFGLLETTL